jgi:hypothetical protein
MKHKNIAAILIVAMLLFVGIGYIKTASKSKPVQESVESEKRGTLRQQIARAKLRGEPQLTLGGIVATYEQPKSLDNVLTRYSLVVAQLVEHKGYIDEHDSISSWYKFKIIETLSRPATPHSFAFFELPTDLLPLRDDEILVSRLGGTVPIDGLSVTVQEHEFPEFRKSRKYLLFLLIDPVKKVGSAGLGPAGTLLIKDDDTFESINERAYSLQNEIQNKYGASFKSLKQGLK